MHTSWVWDILKHTYEIMIRPRANIYYANQQMGKRALCLYGTTFGNLGFISWTGYSGLIAVNPFISISIVMEAAGKSTIDKCHTIYRQRNAIKLTFKWLTLNGCEINISKVWILLRHCIPHGAYMLLKETCSTSPIGVFVYSFIYFYQQKHHWKLRNSTKISHKLCLKLIKKHMKMNAYLVAKC